MKIIRLLTLVFVSVFVLAVIPSVSDAAEMKIGYVNLQRALNECEAGVKAKDKLAEEAKKYGDTLDKMQEDLKKLKDEIEKKSSVWKKNTLEEKQMEFMKKSQEFEKLYEEYGKELNQRKQKREDEIINGLRKIVDEVAKKGGYTHVFERSVGGLLVAPAEDDMTEEVIKIYNGNKKK